MKDEDSKLFLEALQNVVKKNKDIRKPTGMVVPDLASKNLAKGALDKDILRTKGSDIGRDMTEPRTKVSGGTSKIDTASIQKQTPIDNFKEMQRNIEKNKLMRDYKKAIDLGDTKAMTRLKEAAKAFGKVARSGAKMIPLVGGAASLMMSPEDASAAIPGLDSSESVGMSAADENQMLAERQAQMDYSQSPASKDKMRMELLKKLAENKK